MSQYFHHYACFECRKSFKREYDIKKTYKDQLEKPCPECNGPSFDCGRHFKPPKSKDLQQWEKVKLLFENGFRFQHIYDANGEEIPYPETLKETKEFIQRHQNNKHRYRD